MAKITEFQIGAAVGSGMAALAAERSGADFLLALSAGKLRSMGVPSPACLLPIYDGVDFVLDFARTELIGRTKLPVYIGLPLFDPHLDPDRLIGRLVQLGVTGVANFPSTFHFGARAALLEKHGLGAAREISFLAAAQTAGLRAVGYVRHEADAVAMVDAGIETICLNFVLNAEAPISAADDGIGQETIVRSTKIVRAVRARAPLTNCFLGGGPVSSGAGLIDFCQKTKIDGFIGGSTLDRIPLEQSLVNAVASFRSIQELQQKVARLERQLKVQAQRHELVTQSSIMAKTLRRATEMAHNTSPIAISGELGSGRYQIAEFIARSARSKPVVRLQTITYSASDAREFETRLFGQAGDQGRKRRLGLLGLLDAGTLLVLRGTEEMPQALQLRLAELLRSGNFAANGDSAPSATRVRFAFILDEDLNALGLHRTLVDPLRDRLLGNEVSVPPLRDRIEDIPLILRRAVKDVSEHDAEIPAEAMRQLLRHSWPGNLGELKTLVKWMAVERAWNFSEKELLEKLQTDAGRDVPDRRISERELIIDALLKNNLSRTATAEYLGVTRKTLYNKIKRFQIFE